MLLISPSMLKRMLAAKRKKIVSRSNAIVQQPYCYNAVIGGIP